MGQPLRVRVLGDFRLDGVDLGALRSRKARTLLKILALELGNVVSVDALVDALWDSALPSDPARDLSVLVSRARAVVGNDRLVRRDHGYALLAEWCDRDEVEALTREAARRQRIGDGPGSRVAAEGALALGSASLLADEPDAEWARQARSEMAAVVAEARSIAAAAALGAGHAGDAATHARAALAHDPFDETALRLLMIAHVVAGRPASALAAYAQTREQLAEALGVSPSPETEALHQSILIGKPLGVESPNRPVSHRPVKARPSADQSERPERNDSSSRFVGRDRELGLLDAAFERSHHGAQIVVVEGEAGAGKSRLVEAWTESARARGVLVLTGRADEGAGLALQPVLDALDAALPSTGDDGEPVSSATAAWTGVPGPSATSDAMQRSVFAALDTRLGGARPPAGLALIIDDIHLADPVTIEWLASVARRPNQHPLLIVLTKRLEEPVTVAATSVIEVGPLDEASIAELFGADRSAVLWQRTGGNALLLVELAAADSTGAADASDDVADDAANDAAGVVPTTIREAVSGRLRRADPAAATTLRTAALLGSAIDLDLLAGVLGSSPTDVLEHLDEGVRRRFLGEADGQMVFRHELVRTALASDATAARRALVHRRAAELLDERDDANPLEIARHARAGGNLTRAADALADAADLARTRFDLAGAERLLDEAIAYHDGPSVRLRRSRLRMARDDLAGADADAEAALGLGAGAKALELRAWVARNRHDMDTAIRLGTAGAAMARSESTPESPAGSPPESPSESPSESPGDSTTLASCLLAVALAHRGIGDLVSADRVLGEAVGLHPSPALGIDGWLGLLRVHQGRPLEALAALEPMVGAEAGGLLSFWVEHVLQMLAHAYGQVGRADDALTVLARLDIELQRRGSSSRYAGVSSTYRSWILRNLGVAGAEDIARSGIEAGATAEIRAQSLLDLADTLLVLRRNDEAGGVLGRATAALETRWFHNRWRAEQRAGVITARLQLVNGLSSEARNTAMETATAAAGRGDARYAPIARLLTARAEARLGRRVDVEAVMDDLQQLGRVAAMEAWWMAADVADDTGIQAAGQFAEQSAMRLAVEAGERAAALRVAVARRLT